MFGKPFTDGLIAAVVNGMLVSIGYSLAIDAGAPVEVAKIVALGTVIVGAFSAAKWAATE